MQAASHADGRKLEQPDHARLWYCLEAFCAVCFDIPIEITGDPLWLLPPPGRPHAMAALDQAVRAQRAAHETFGMACEGSVF
jgi:hypothetical protein